MTRRTIVVPSRLAWHEERFRAAQKNVLGLQILTPAQLGGRLAGGFLERHRGTHAICHQRRIRASNTLLKFGSIWIALKQHAGWSYT